MAVSVPDRSDGDRVGADRPEAAAGVSRSRGLSPWSGRATAQIRHDKETATAACQEAKDVAQNHWSRDIEG